MSKHQCFSYIFSVMKCCRSKIDQAYCVYGFVVTSCNVYLLQHLISLATDCHHSLHSL